MNLDALVGEILDVAREQLHGDAVIIIRDRIAKDVIRPLERARANNRYDSHDRFKCAELYCELCANGDN